MWVPARHTHCVTITSGYGTVNRHKCQTVFTHCVTCPNAISESEFDKIFYTAKPNSSIKIYKHRPIYFIWIAQNGPKVWVYGYHEKQQLIIDIVKSWLLKKLLVNPINILISILIVVKVASIKIFTCKSKHCLTSKHRTFVWHLYNAGPTSSTLVQHCTNVIQMFCVCWVCDLNFDMLFISAKQKGSNYLLE